MRYLDLSFEGRQLAERNQLDNGKLPHGGHRGSKRHPPSHLSYEKGREFQQKLDQELGKMFEEEELLEHGHTPSWTFIVHKEPSYTDESPLITRNLLAGSKLEQANAVNLFNRTSLLPNKCGRPVKNNGLMYYRPNRMHQYLTATELKNYAEEEVNVKHGRPTRTTLLRARQRCSSAPNNKYDTKREFLHRLDEIKSTCPVSPSTEYLQLQSVRDGESLHSYLTGARYNRAHCLDSKSVEHSGVYMPRHNPAHGSFFRGPKGQEYLAEFVESPRLDLPSPLTPVSPKRRPMTAPSTGRRAATAPLSPPSKDSAKEKSQSSRAQTRSAGPTKYKHLKLNIVGNRLPIGQFKESLKLPSLPGQSRPKSALDETYRVNQPPPTPNSVGPSKQDEPGESALPAGKEENVEEPVVVESEQRDDVMLEDDKKDDAVDDAVKESNETVTDSLVTVPRVVAESPAVEDDDEEEDDAVEKEKEKETVEHVVDEKVDEKGDESRDNVADGNAEEEKEEKVGEEVAEVEQESGEVKETVEEQDSEAVVEGENVESEGGVEVSNEQQRETEEEEVVEEVVQEESQEVTEEAEVVTESVAEEGKAEEDEVEEVVEETAEVVSEEQTGDADIVEEELLGEVEDVSLMKSAAEEEEIEEEKIIEEAVKEQEDDEQKEEVVEEVREENAEAEEEEDTKEAPVKEVRFFITEEGVATNANGTKDGQQVQEEVEDDKGDDT